MTPVPLELPVAARDAIALAEIVFDMAERRPFRADVRNRITARLHGRKFETMTVHPGSLSCDPVHGSAYFVAADGLAGGRETPVLLRLALASSPATALFPNPLLITRSMGDAGREFVINAIPFGTRDHLSIRTFAERIDRAFLPDMQGAVPPVILEGEANARVTAAAFHGFRQVLRNDGVNTAAFTYRGSEPASFLSSTVWGAIRAGWREGFSITGRIPLDACDLPTLAGWRGYTGFVIETGTANLSTRVDECEAAYRTIAAFTRVFDFGVSAACEVPPDELAEFLRQMRARRCPVHWLEPRVEGEAQLQISRLVESARPFGAAIVVPASCGRQVNREAAGRVSAHLSLAGIENPIDEIVELAAALRT